PPARRPRALALGSGATGEPRDDTHGVGNDPLRLASTFRYGCRYSGFRDLVCSGRDSTSKRGPRAADRGSAQPGGDPDPRHSFRDLRRTRYRYSRGHPLDPPGFPGGGYGGRDSAVSIRRGVLWSRGPRVGHQQRSSHGGAARGLDPHFRAGQASGRKAAVSGRKLVIVESPAKARTISSYLGPEFTVEASVGHIRDLPQPSELPAELKKGPYKKFAI